ncbi:ATP-binding protein [Nocardioides zeae]|uniref:ATP-binding protein n=1 Tax=Nocardioides imazamoxiresistens TaxID=3231893 RepID=A0ABU3Q0J2_9ACTN|nr:ATP-binding protein [Nocardioides zeae]MDT9594961.1 ATP-binding protein [Nocardioides zeae]
MIDPSFVARAEPGEVVLHGDLEAYDVEPLLAVLRRCSDDHRDDLVLDLAAVTYLPSPVLGALARLRVAASRGGWALTLVVRDGTVAQRALHVSGLPFETVTEAPGAPGETDAGSADRDADDVPAATAPADGGWRVVRPRAMVDVLSDESLAADWADVDLPHGPEAGPRARATLREVFGAMTGLAESSLQDVLIVAGELVINAVDHGRPGPLGTIRLSWLLNDGRVCLRVTDAGYDPGFADGLPGEAAPESVRGRGLFMVDAISEDWCVLSDPITETTHVAARLGRVRA